MKTHKLFPVEVLEFEYPSLLDWAGLDTFLSRHIRYMGPSGISHTHTQMHQEVYLQDVVNWFNDCLEEAREHWTFACDKLEITTCWANANWAEVIRHIIHMTIQCLVSRVYSMRVKMERPLYSRIHTTRIKYHESNPIDVNQTIDGKRHLQEEVYYYSLQV